MKKKLLHERLRDWEYSNETAITVLTSKEAEAFADEIEKYYIPRPRFEDGTPMHLGDICDFGDYFPKGERVKEIFGLHYTNYGDWSIQPLHESHNVRLDNCKRPTKVLDANGVEIKVGNTVWHIGDKSHGTVTSVIIDKTWHGYPVKVAWDKGDEGFYSGNALTLREPDSLEKLHRDMSSATKGIKGQHFDKHINVDTAQRWVDRLAAMIERDA